MEELISHVVRVSGTNKKVIVNNLSILNDKLGVDKVKHGEISLERIIDWCDVYICRFIIVGCIVENEEHEIALLFMKEKNKYIDRIRNCSEFRKSYPHPINCTTRCLMGTYDIITNLSLDVRIAFNMFQNIKLYSGMTKKHCYDIVSYFYLQKLSKNDRSIFNVLYSKKYIKDDLITIFSKENNWKRDVYNTLYDIHSKRTVRTSAYPEEALKAQLNKDIRSLRLIENYVISQFPIRNLQQDPIQWFFNTCSIDTLKQSIITIANGLNPKNERVRSKDSRHHSREFVVNILGLVKRLLTSQFLCKNDLHILTVNNILDNVIDQRENAPPDSRRHFTYDEIDRIVEISLNNSKTCLIICILKEVGLRISALINLTIKHVFIDKNTVRKEIRIIEKGNKYRTFPTSENLEKYCRKYIEDNPFLFDNIENWLFPSKSRPSKHISTNSVRTILKNLAKKANVFGNHIHPHAFRHTLVNNLMAGGNRIENVSKYMGHSSVATTEQYYWTDTIENIVPLMNIPWLNINRLNISYPVDESESVVSGENSDDISVDLLVNVLSIYHSVLSNDQKLEIKEKIPNIEDIFQVICEYSISSSMDDIRTNVSES